MYRILVPVDGSDVALRALNHALRLVRLIGAAEIHLVNIQPPIPASVGDFVGDDTIARYHQDEADNALATARKLLQDQGIPVNAAMRIGRAGESIVDYANQLSCDEIIMGTRGLGRIESLVMGSVATEVVHLAELPVTLTK